MQIQRYEWSDHFRMASKADPQQVGKEIDRLRKKLGREDGDIMPSELVEAATNPDSPLHGLFTWDQDKAARLQRESEARLVLRSLRVIVVSSGKEVQVIGNVAVKTANSGNSKAYVSTTLAAFKENLRTQMIDDAITHLNGSRKRLEQLQGAKDALDHVDKAIDVVKKIRARTPDRPSASAS